MSDGGALLTALFGHMALTALPMAAAALVAATRGVRSVPILLAIALAGGGVIAAAAFWAYYADPVLGEAFGYLVVAGSICVVVGCLRGGSIDRGLLRALAAPLALWALGSAFLVFLGFAHGGADTALATSGSRFSGPLPSDNDIPRFYTEWFFHNGHAGDAPLYPADWLSSDRPPLQVGYVLSQRTFGWDDTGLHYQVTGVLLQQLWIVGAWALLLAAGLGRVTRALAIVVVLLSDVAIVHGFYVWPKLLPAAFLLAAAALVLTPLWPRLRRDSSAGALVAALLALAMLGHGSSVFGIVPLALVAAFRGLPGLRWIGAALLAAAVLIGPWSAYQRYVEPPGNRLAKWMLAGVTEIDGRSTTTAIVDSYRAVGIAGTLENKADNFGAITGGEPAWSLAEQASRAIEDGRPEEALGALRTASFFHLLPSLGLLLLGPVAMAVGFRRRGRDPAAWRFALTCFVTALTGLIVWGLLLFGNDASRTTLHHGSLALPILALCGCAAGLRAVIPRFALYYLGLATALSLALYAPAFESPPGTAWSPLAILLAGLSLTGFLAVAFRSGDAVEGGSRLAR